MGCARRCKWNERPDWRASRCLRASHKALHWLVPTQREQDLLPLSNNSQRRLPNVSSISLKKNRYKELLRAGDSLENQEGMHLLVMTCDAVTQRNSSLWPLNRSCQKAMLSCQTIDTDNLASLVCSKGLGEEGSGEVHGAEIASDQREAMEHPIAVVIEAADLPLRSDAGGGGQIQSARKVNGGEAARTQQEPVGKPGDIVVVANDLSPIVDPSGHRADGTGKVNRGEIARVQQKTVKNPRRISVGTNNFATVVQVLKDRGGGAGQVKDGERAAIEHEAARHIAAVHKTAADDTQGVHG